MEIALMDVFGAAGIPIPYSQVVPSIQKRVVDGARSAIIVMGPSKFYTVAKYLTRTAGGYIPVGGYASLKRIKKLPKDLQTAIWEEAAKLTDPTVEVAIEITHHWEKQWVKEGGEVIDLSDADRKEFFRRAKPLGDKILGSNPKIAPMYKLIKAAAEKTRAAAAEKHKATMMRLEQEVTRSPRTIPAGAGAPAGGAQIYEGNKRCPDPMHVRVAPKGMGINEFVAMEEGFFRDEGLEVEFDMQVFRGTQASWKGLDYFERPAGPAVRGKRRRQPHPVRMPVGDGQQRGLGHGQGGA